MTGKALASTPSKVATNAAGFVPGLVGGGEEGGDDESTTASKNAAQAASDSQELVRNFAASQLLGKKQHIKHGTLQTFESVSSDITRCLLERAGRERIVSGGLEAAMGSGRRRPPRAPDAPDGPDGPRRDGDGPDGPDTPDTPEKKSGLLARTLAPGLGPAALLGTVFGLPMAVGKLYGSDTSAPVGQGPGSKGDGDMPAQGGVASVLDRLSAVYGFIPGFNPAGAAIGALGRRVGA